MHHCDAHAENPTTSTTARAQSSLSQPRLCERSSSRLHEGLGLLVERRAFLDRGEARDLESLARLADGQNPLARLALLHRTLFHRRALLARRLLFLHAAALGFAHGLAH